MARLLRPLAVAFLALSLVSAAPEPAPVLRLPAPSTATVVLGMANVGGSFERPPVPLPSGPLPAATISRFPVIQSPTRDRIAPDPIPTVADAKLWARQTLSRADYAALYAIVWGESKWDPAATNRSSGACGLGQFWPCSKMSATLADWRSQPIAQLRDYVIPYARSRYGSLPGAAAFWAARGWW